MQLAKFQLGTQGQFFGFVEQKAVQPLEPAAGFPRHPGMAEFDTDGHFAASTWSRGDGLMPGRYKVGVECWKVPPTMGGPPELSYVADSHQAAARSPIELIVEQGKPATGVEWSVPKNPKAN